MQASEGFGAINITADSTMLQKWEQDEFLSEHAQYLQATAALTSPPLPVTAVANTGEASSELTQFTSLDGTF